MIHGQQVKNCLQILTDYIIDTFSQKEKVFCQSHYYQSIQSNFHENQFQIILDVPVNSI